MQDIRKELELELKQAIDVSFSIGPGAQAKLVTFMHLWNAECRVKSVSFGEVAGDVVKECSIEDEAVSCGATALNSTRPKAVEAA